MKFEVINDKSNTVMSTKSITCIPDKDMLSSLSKAGHRFKLDGKIITIKRLIEKIKEIDNGDN